jgi:hypothetical protein
VNLNNMVNDPALEALNNKQTHDWQEVIDPNSRQMYALCQFGFLRFVLLYTLRCADTITTASPVRRSGSAQKKWELPLLQPVLCTSY